MELSDVLRKVRFLVAMAEQPIDPTLSPEEAAATKREQDAARARADKLMESYAIKEWQAAQGGDAPAIRPTFIRIDIGAGDSPYLDETATLANIVANYCRCSSVWMSGSGWGLSDRQEHVRVYGYESDLRYFELLFTTLYLHMTGAVFPVFDPARSIEDNVYSLHNAGMNWWDIAEANGWRPTASRPGEPKLMYRNENTGERASWAKAVNQYKRAYQRAIKARGEEFFRIPPSGSRDFRFNAAQGYLARIRRRLDEQAGKREQSTVLVLKDRDHNIADLVASEHPDLRSTGARSVHFNAEAWARGTRHADTASLHPEAGSKPNPALGR